MQKNDSFTARVHSIVANIPRGSVLTYAQVASQAGSPRAYRAVASLMAKNFDPNIPCHRVVRSDGTVGDYNRGGASKKRQLLLAEGYHQ